MSLNYAELELIVPEVARTLEDAGIQKVYEADRDTWVLRTRSHGETSYLLISIEPGFTRLYLVGGKPNQPEHPSAFTMQMRKWVEGAHVEGIELLEGDRIVRLDLARRDPEYEGEGEAPVVSVELVLELTGTQGNAYLLRDGKIIGLARRSRGLQDYEPGDVWSPPENTFTAAEDERLGLAAVRPGARSERLAEYFHEAIAEAERTAKKKSLTSTLKSQAKRLKRRLSAVEGDLERAEGAMAHKRRGELLQGAYGRKLDRGATSIEVTDFYDPDLAKVEIEIDPKVSLQHNIDRAFHEYRRLSEATERIEERLLETMELLEAVEEARIELRDIDDLEALEAFEEAMRGSKILPRRSKRGSPQQSGPKKPFRTYYAASGAEILVGRNARGNDELTTHYARGRDIWLHARDWPGSHVVLRQAKNSEPRSDDLVDAALLAAHYSGGSDDSLVDVTWTRAKHVRKPKGAPPGLVTHSGGNTIAVRPSAERLAEIMERAK